MATSLNELRRLADKETERRNKKMMALHRSGKTHQEIADAYGITRQRAQQIIAREKSKSE